MDIVSKEANAYVVYDPPAEGYPFLGVLFRAEARPRVFVFPTQDEAITFLTSKALKKLPSEPATRPEAGNCPPSDRLSRTS
jgi:hypothetical protein